MAYVKLYRQKLKENFDFLTDLFKKHDVDWGVVTKVLCGNEKFLQEIIDLGAMELHDSRIRNLRAIKKINPDVQTVYIKPPAGKNIKKIIQVADVSFNTEIQTIRKLSKEAVKQNKKHKIIIMIEMGDLREGVMGEELTHFYGEVFELPNIEVIGLGTNLNCLHGVMPSQDKLIQLSLYKQLIEAQFDKKIPWVSGGSSVTIPLLFKQQLPIGINHFRVGETLFFGADLFTNDTIEGMNADVFKLYAQIIEMTEKPRVPIGTLAQNPSGVEYEIKEEDYGKMHYRAIIDVGLLDCHPDFIIPDDDRITVAEASSDMLVLDMGNTGHDYKVGDMVTFKLKYMGALGLLNSDYVEKIVE